MDFTWHLAHKGGTQRRITGVGRPIPTIGEGQLPLCQGLCHPGEKHFCWGSRPGNGGRTAHPGWGGEAMWMHIWGALPRAAGSNWRRGQSQNNLRWQLGACQLPHTTKHSWEDHAPTIMDCVQAIHWLNTTKERPTPTVATGTDLGWVPPHKNTTWAILKADVSKAHRRIKVTQEGWRFQVAQLEGEWWINKVGTYGVASAQLYWGRMAALLLRLCYMIFPQVDWGFVFVDDFCWLLRTDTASRDMAQSLLLLAALGCPLRWHKTVLSEVNTWLCFQVNPCGPVVDFPMYKKTTLGSLLNQIISGNSFTAKEIERALGRLNWATAAWPLSRPFLQPFWAWKAATTSSGRPNTLIRSFARLLLHLLHHPQAQPCPYDPASNWWGASDASAHPVDGAYIGGWIANRESPCKEHTWWFHYKVPLEDHDWAHKDGDPTRRIAALDMFGTLILTHFLLILSGKSLLRTRLSVISDNQGNIFALLNQKTKHMPTSAFLMQLIVMLHSAGVQLAPSHEAGLQPMGGWTHSSPLHGLSTWPSTSSERGFFPFQISMGPSGWPDDWP